MSRRDEVAASIARLQAELAELDAMVEEPDGFPVVVFFQKSWRKPDKSYTYVGVKIDTDSWYITAQDLRVRRPDGKVSWSELVEFVDQAEATQPEILIGRGVETLRKES